MCVVSMVMDHYTEKWRELQPYLPNTIGPSSPNPSPHTLPAIQPFKPVIPQADIDEFYRLLDRAREYDKRNNEPECELEEKKETLKTLAKQLGVEIVIP